MGKRGTNSIGKKWEREGRITLERNGKETDEQYWKEMGKRGTNTKWEKAKKEKRKEMTQYKAEREKKIAAMKTI